MQRQHFLNLLDKYIAGKASIEEQRLLEEYYKRLDNLSELELSAQEEEAVRLAMLQNIQLGILPQQVISLKPVRSFKWLYAAASILVLCSVAFYLNLNKSTPAKVASKTPVHDIAPGSNKAVLTLSNGKKLILNSSASGLLANQGATKIIKGANGELVYNSNTESKNTHALTYNTISIPKGGQYQVILPDGSKVLLNAASTLTYPTAFNGKNRHVVLTGEAYFEIAKNKEKPFIVEANEINVKVLGTHFDVSAYSDDSATMTTLLEGSVKMEKGPVSTQLSPGEQGIAIAGQKNMITQAANIEQVMAWTNGQFVFKDVSIKEVMKIAARWYDVDVEYHGNVEFKKFGGTTSRYKNITELLDNMTETGRIHYKIEGRRVILMN